MSAGVASSCWPMYSTTVSIAFRPSEWVIPVSYTHLDVYKRQGKRNRKKGCSRDDVMNLLKTFYDTMCRRFDEQNAIVEDMINKNEMKSENKKMMREINTSSVELKSDNLRTSLNEFRNEIKSAIRARNVELKTEINKQDEKVREINEKLEKRSEIIAGMKGGIIININKIQDEVNESRTLKEEVENDTVTGEYNENKNNEGTSTKAVSYTHLDVYKRQVLV